ncbi:Cytochrome c oxidase subunit 6A [Malassezia nana]|uniref:Cytochrome c oxidase subunit 6A n=1 Tax=Malassezia nana TaxID=180528 RepID=A0AAF0EN38_9BASI|nr:Cytochrome c oxidase subunit 6A [Malassezia nana]
MAAFRAVIPRSAALRAAQPTLRRFNSSFQPNPEAAKAFTEARQHAFEHAATAVFGAYMYNVEMRHAAHQEHLLQENNGELPERPNYEYLNIKNKKFPWGQQSLFFNPKVNYPSAEM